MQAINGILCRDFNVTVKDKTDKNEKWRWEKGRAWNLGWVYLNITISLEYNGIYYYNILVIRDIIVG